MESIYRDDKGRNWYSSELLTVGDYCGSDIGEANIKFLESRFAENSKHVTNHGSLFSRDEKIYTDNIFEEDDYNDVYVLFVREAYNTVSAYIRMDVNEEIEDIINALSDYPVLDDDMLYSVQSEYIEQALPDCLYDFFREQDDDFSDFVQEKFTEEQMFDFFLEAVEMPGSEFVFEHNTAILPSNYAQKVHTELVRILNDNI